jgi:hypothetical protein
MWVRVLGLPEKEIKLFSNLVIDGALEDEVLFYPGLMKMKHWYILSPEVMWQSILTQR